jgi:CMP-N-acetylneuraminic acid synthetase
MEVLALIPARAGSKGLPHKNILSFCGKPLIAHSILQAKSCSAVTRVIVSTDSERYALIAREYGAETPFLRPADISGDHATDLQVFRHALEWLKREEGYEPEICVHLRPTHPNRRAEDIAAVIELLRAHSHWDSVRSVVPAPETPFKMWFLRQDGTLEPVVQCEIPDAHSVPRQLLPLAYLQNACVDGVRTRTILEMNSIAGTQIGAYVMREFHDIDTYAQLQAAATAFSGSAGLPAGQTFCFDIDGVIASLTPGHQYELAEPLADNIQRINRLYDHDNRIVLFTARGSLTGKDWQGGTREQLARWGVKYHELRFGKPAADYYVDDQTLSLAEFAGWVPLPPSPVRRLGDTESLT